jgi:TetR/AcrR family tetracycline transcriptional repressor
MIVTCHAASDRCRGLLAGYYRKVGLGVTQGEVQVRRVQGRDGRRGRPGRGLSLDRIVSTTLELVDEEGIGAATMREVASRLGVRSMSLYRYVRDRDELLDAVVERIVGELADDPEVQLRPVDGWRPYLTGMAHGVRRYARAHPHAFPLVATRPPSAPWVNPPLRSLRWVEAMLSGLAGEGFSDEQVLFTYRTFNGFLLGYLLLETSAMALRDPKPGDGSFASTDTLSDEFSSPSGTATANPVPGGLSPARSPEQRAAIADADGPRELIDPADEIDARRFPTLHRLAAGLAQDQWEQEFETGLAQMLDRVGSFVADGPGLGRG